MSRGAGRVERAIDAVFAAEPDDAHTTEELIADAYPGLDRIEKKHRVAVIRAARNVCKRLPEWEAWRHATVVFVNRASVMSYAIGRLKADNASTYRSNDHSSRSRRMSLADDIRARLALGGENHHHIVEGGAWWRHTELWKADNRRHTSPRITRIK